MSVRQNEVQQIDLTKLNLQQLQQLKNEFESVGLYMKHILAHIHIY